MLAREEEESVPEAHRGQVLHVAVDGLQQGARRHHVHDPAERPRAGVRAGFAHPEATQSVRLASSADDL
eukprot:4033693-Lingulodinium_polyedra.AAC.1